MRNTTVLKPILAGGLVAGSLDLLYAFIYFGYRGGSPVSILQSIASGVLGMSSYERGVLSAFLGLVLHMLILVVAAGIYYFAAVRFRFLVKRAVWAGCVFGICVYMVMNFVVLPLSAFPHTPSYTLKAVVPGLLAHILLVGIPIALINRRWSNAANYNSVT